MTALLEVKISLANQWQEMINSGRIPCMELQTGENDWLVVDIELTEKGFVFSFDKDENLSVWFSGEVIELNNTHYLLPFDEYFDRLDTYLEVISNEITEGYLLPNDLYYSEY